MFVNGNLVDSSFVVVPLVADTIVAADGGTFAATLLACFLFFLSFFFSAPVVCEVAASAPGVKGETIVGTFVSMTIRFGGCCTDAIRITGLAISGAAGSA